MNPSASPEDTFLSRLRGQHGILDKVTRTYARSPADREDLGQEIVTQLWRSYVRYDERFAFATWMYRVALNVAISFARSESRRAGRFVQTDPQALEQTSGITSYGDERLDAVSASIEQLDDMHRALVLLYLDGYRYEEIAAILGLSTTNVATKLQRVKATLRDTTLQTLQKDDAHGTR